MRFLPEDVGMRQWCDRCDRIQRSATGVTWVYDRDVKRSYTGVRRTATRRCEEVRQEVAKRCRQGDMKRCNRGCEARGVRSCRQGGMKRCDMRRKEIRQGFDKMRQRFMYL